MTRHELTLIVAYLQHWIDAQLANPRPVYMKTFSSSELERMFDVLCADVCEKKSEPPE